MDKIKEFLRTKAGRVVVTIITAVIIYGILLIAAAMNSFAVALVVFAVCAYFGWKALNFITPNIFLIMPLAGWLLYFLIKGIVSFFVGFFVAPFQIGRMVSKSVSQSIS